MHSSSGLSHRECSSNSGSNEGCICYRSEIIKPYYTTDSVASSTSLCRASTSASPGLTSSMRFNATRWTLSGKIEFHPCVHFSRTGNREKRDEVTGCDDNCNMCKINDVAQLSVINRGIIIATIINTAYSRT